MKKFCVAIPALLGSVSLLAAEGDITLDTTFANKLATAFSNWATAVTPFVMTIAGIFLGFWLIRFVLRVVKGVASAGK